MSLSPGKNVDKVETLLDDITVIGIQKEDSYKNTHPDMVTCMKSIVNYFQSNATVTISSPFQGTCLQISKDERNFYFGSRQENTSPARIGVVDISSQEIVLDEGVSDKSVWTIALSKDEKFIYAAGQKPVISKFLISDLSEVDTFVGHDNEINKVLVTDDDKWLFSSSDDATVRMWSVAKTNPREAVLLTSSGRIYAIDISRDQRYLCAGDSNGKIIISELAYSLKNPGTMIYTTDNERAIWSVKFSPSGAFFATGDDLGIIKLFKFYSWDTLAEFSHGDRIRDLDISIAEDIIVSASDNTQVKIWDIQKRYKEIIFTKHTNWVKSAIIMKDQKRIISYGDDKAIMIWKIPTFEAKKIMDTYNMRVLNIWFSESRMQLEGVCIMNDEKFIMSWDNNGSAKIMMHIDIDTPEFCKNFDQNEEIFIAGAPLDATVENSGGDVGESYTMICIYNVGSLKLVRSHLIKAEMQSFYVSGSYLFIGESFKISVWNYETCTQLRTIFAHNGEIRAVVTAFSDSLLFTLGTDQLLKKFTIDFQEPQENFSKEVDYRDGFGYFSNELSYEERDEYSQGMSFTLQVSEDFQYLYAATLTKFEIIYTRNFSLIFSSSVSYIGILKNLNNTLCLIHKQGMDIYSSKSFQVLSQLLYEFPYEKVIIGSENRFLYFLGGDLITKTQNPLRCKEITLIGPSLESSKFQDHVNNAINGKCDHPYFQSHWLIEPLHINLLHIYAFFNLYDALKDAIIGQENGNRIAFINSSEHFSALSITLKMGFAESTDAIVDGLRKVVKKDTSEAALKKMIFQSIEENMAELNLVGNKSLEKLYKEILVTEDLPSLPNFCPLETSLPMLVKSDLFYPFYKDFGLNDEIPDFGVAVLFSKTLMRFYLTLGSSKSIEFIKSIEDCPNNDIYYTKFIQLVLQEKWKGVRWYMWAQAFMYLCYVVLLSLFTSYESCRKPWFLILPFSLSGILYVYELVFVVLGPLTYFSDFWNVVDTIRAWLMIAYTVMVWTGFFHIIEEENTDERYMLAILLFISWMRGITYFRINASTRYLTKLLFQVLGDIVAFLIILFYSAVAFALMFRSFDSDLSTDFFPSLTYSWLIILGNWENPNDPDFFSLIMFFATLLNPIISLNLLIAILSDTFERVSEDEVIADGQELAGMIIEIETLMFWARGKNNKTFLHIMEDDNVDDEAEEDLNKIINNMRSKILYINNHFKLHDISRQKLKDAFEKGEQDLSLKLGTLLRK